MQPICVTCRVFFRPKKNGQGWEEMVPDGQGGWQSYKLWEGDLWECRGCGAEIIVGTGRAPIAEHFQPEYEREVNGYAPTIRVEAP